MKLWRDSSLPDGLEVLRASCFHHHYPAHFHDEFVIAAFARGAQRHRISRFEGIAVPATLMIIPPGEVHTGEAVTPHEGWDYCAFYPSARFIERIADDVIGGHGQISFGVEILRHDPDTTDELLRASVILDQSRDVLERECAVYDAFGTVIRRYGQRSAKPRLLKSPNANIRGAVDFLEQCYGQQISVGNVAAITGLSEYHFMRVFRAGTGLTVHQYLTQIRLARAKTLLLKGVGAAETALAVGFFDQSHFINRFHAYFGVTPGAFQGRTTQPELRNKPWLPC